MPHPIVPQILAHPELIGGASPKMTDFELAETERQLGFRLPQALRDIYQFVGNGGFGPHLGLFMGGVNGCETEGQNIVGFYRLMRSAPDRYPWPEGQLTFFDWGCASRCTLDCTVDDGVVAYYDPGFSDLHYADDDPRHEQEPVVEDILAAFRWDADCLSDWFERWLDGRARMGGSDLPWMPAGVALVRSSIAKS